MLRSHFGLHIDTVKRNIQTSRETDHSKVFWLKHGEANTKNFHAQVSRQRCINNIQMLLDDHRQPGTEEQGMCDIVTQYFESYYNSYGLDFDIFFQYTFFNLCK
ncbi:hypothetical protein ES288_D07G098100v1 [Gossypium darwinii]|uniref:Uncharacterized protein n=1 Tax=Gossypium darwinii TaxID=34276 RepID=A0A5D2BUU7_GOSDA|nr:hypothetical protein ES288_D07G098100v1 [Gossypium darwinii]